MIQGCDPKLIDYCKTKRQEEVYAVYIEENGNASQTARNLNIDQSTVAKMIMAIKKTAAKHGYAPEYNMVSPAAPGFMVKGTSTLYDSEGNVKTQWVKTDIDKERHAEMLEAAMTAFTDELPKANPVKHDGDKCYSDLLNLFVITDLHLGMGAWGDETGADWDMEIAEQLLNDWFATAIELSPNAETAILCNLGDFFHFDGLAAVTPLSGHLLDADTRYQHMIRVAIKLFRKVIKMLLKKHKNVHCLFAQGNHDMATSGIFREMFHAFYDDEPRVTTDNSPKPYYAYEHGETLLMFHHGHKKRIGAGLDSTLVAIFKEEYGMSKHAVCHLGHYHHNKVIESSLMQMEQHRTLSAPDSYASSGGWISGRDAKCITYSKRFGEVSRLTISPDLIESRK